MSFLFDLVKTSTYPKGKGSKKKLVEFSTKRGGGGGGTLGSDVTLNLVGVFVIV